MFPMKKRRLEPEFFGETEAPKKQPPWYLSVQFKSGSSDGWFLRCEEADMVQLVNAIKNAPRLHGGWTHRTVARG